MVAAELRGGALCIPASNAIIDPHVARVVDRAAEVVVLAGLHIHAARVAEARVFAPLVAGAVRRAPLARSRAQGAAHGERAERDDAGFGDVPVRRRVLGRGLRVRDRLVETDSANAAGVGIRREDDAFGVRACDGRGVVRRRQVGSPVRAGLEARKRRLYDLRPCRRNKRIGARLAEAGNDNP